MKIPAGIVDHDFEIFSYEGHLMFTHDGQTKSFDKMPASLKYWLEEMIAADPDVQLALDCLDLHDPMDRLRQFSFCRFSSFDLVADVTEGGNMHPEFTICEKRSRCPYEGTLCLSLNQFKLSSREIQVIQLLTMDLPYKLIADRMDVTTNTVRTHIQNIQSKLGLHSSRAILQWAYEHQLIDQLNNNCSLWETEEEVKSSGKRMSGELATFRTF